MELRETIDTLRVRNEEAQAVIQGALNNPDNMKGLDTDQFIFLFSSVAHLPLLMLSFLVHQTCEFDVRTHVRASPVSTA